MNKYNDSTYVVTTNTTNTTKTTIPTIPLNTQLNTQYITIGPIRSNFSTIYFNL